MRSPFDVFLGELRAEGKRFKGDRDGNGPHQHRISQAVLTHLPRVYCRRRSSSNLLFRICMINVIPYYYNTLFWFRQFYFCQKTNKKFESLVFSDSFISNDVKTKNIEIFFNISFVNVTFIINITSASKLSSETVYLI